jgi:hypothetical protein
MPFPYKNRAIWIPRFYNIVTYCNYNVFIKLLDSSKSKKWKIFRQKFQINSVVKRFYYINLRSYGVSVYLTTMIYQGVHNREDIQ